MHWKPDMVFEAALRLREMAYGPDLFDEGRDIGDSSKSRRDPKRVLDYMPCYRGGLVPNRYTGALGTTGGLSIHTVNRWPAWIETPWGEWNCWANQTLWHGRWARLEVFERFRASLQIDEGRSQCKGTAYEILALRGVGDIQLPPYQWCSIARGIDEWVRLCKAHNPPIEVPQFYLEKYV